MQCHDRALHSLPRQVLEQVLDAIDSLHSAHAAIKGIVMHSN